MEWLRENNRTCSVVDFLSMAIELREFMAFQFEFRFGIETKWILSLNCCLGWFDMDFWSRSRWHKESAKNFIKRISRSNAMMKDLLLRKWIGHCYTVSRRKKNFRIFLEAPWARQHSNSLRIGWVLDCEGLKCIVAEKHAFLEAMRWWTVCFFGSELDIMSLFHVERRIFGFFLKRPTQAIMEIFFLTIG
jgi:hypothetical protein